MKELEQNLIRIRYVLEPLEVRKQHEIVEFVELFAILCELKHDQTFAIDKSDGYIDEEKVS